MRKVIFYKQIGKDKYETRTVDANLCLGHDGEWMPPIDVVKNLPVKSMNAIMKEGKSLKAEGVDVSYQQVTGW